MSVKSYQAKVICDSADTRADLWEHHRRFNEAVRKMVRILFKMKRGEWGEPQVAPLFQEMAQSLYRGKPGTSQRAHAPIEAVTNPKTIGKETTNRASWASIVNKIKEQGVLLFNAEHEFPYPFWFRRKVYQSGVARFKNYHANLEERKKARSQWRKAKEKWEEEHSDFMEKVKPLFDKFEEEHGQLDGSRRRWPKYLEFLSKDPEIAKLCGPENPVQPLTGEEAKLPAGVRFDAFVEKNEDIGKLDKLDFEWRVRMKGNSPPRPATWTEPLANKHPEFFTYQRDEAYKPQKLDLAKGELELRLCAGCNCGPRTADAVKRRLRFVCDPRLAEMRQDTRNREVLHYTEPLTGKTCKATIQGIKLVFRNRHGDPRNTGNWDPYLIFSVEVADEPQTLRLPGEKDPETGKKTTPADIPDGTRFLAVDFGQRALGACSVCAFKNGKPLPPDKVFLLQLPGLSFNDIGRHERMIRRRTSKMFRSGDRRRRTRRPPRGGTTFREHRRHIRKMKEDQYKKATNMLLRAAVRHKASVILVEDLESYKPKRARSRRENRRRMQWNIQRIIEFLDKTAKPLGIRLWRVSPGYSSQFCSACGHPGKRFSIPRKTQWERFYARRHGPIRKPVIEPGGQFFVCSNPDCPRPSGIIHADVNASLNLHRILAETFERPEGKGRQRTWRGKPLDWEAVGKTCDERLQKHFRKKADLAGQTPW